MVAECPHNIIILGLGCVYMILEQSGLYWDETVCHDQILGRNNWGEKSTTEATSNAQTNLKINGTHP